MIFPSRDRRIDGEANVAEIIKGRDRKIQSQKHWNNKKMRNTTREVKT